VHNVIVYHDLGDIAKFWPLRQCDIIYRNGDRWLLLQSILSSAILCLICLSICFSRLLPNLSGLLQDYLAIS